MSAASGVHFPARNRSRASASLFVRRCSCPPNAFRQSCGQLHNCLSAMKTLDSQRIHPGGIYVSMNGMYDDLLDGVRLTLGPLRGWQLHDPLYAPRLLQWLLDVQKAA